MKAPPHSRMDCRHHHCFTTLFYKKCLKKTAQKYVPREFNKMQTSHGHLSLQQHAKCPKWKWDTLKLNKRRILYNRFVWRNAHKNDEGACRTEKNQNVPSCLEYTLNFIKTLECWIRKSLIHGQCLFSTCRQNTFTHIWFAYVLSSIWRMPTPMPGVICCLNASASNGKTRASHALLGYH